MAFDPYVLDKSDTKTLAEALKEAKAAVIATAHEDFQSLMPKYFLDHGIQVVIDGRNCLPKERFLTSSLIYKGIGR